MVKFLSQTQPPRFEEWALKSLTVDNGDLDGASDDVKLFLGLIIVALEQDKGIRKVFIAK